MFRIRGGTEFRAADRLLRFGVVALNPCHYAYTRKNAKGEAVLTAQPVLHGYFVGMIPLDSWWQITNACHDDGSPVLGRALSVDGERRPLSWPTWHTIMDLNAYYAEAPTIEPQRGLKPGMTVVLKDGMHAGKRFRLQAMGKSEKVKIVIHLLGGLRDVEIKDPRAVEVVDAA